jgi:predicted glycoside hydrolase/deacetylase ChbG (UPF0249 family)
MRYLIVNADDFGASAAVNRGIIEAHERGIVTSASLMTEMRGSEDAARVARQCPALSVGLHACLGSAPEDSEADSLEGDADRTALEAQLRRFEVLVGRLPTHLDSHHHVHTRPPRLLLFREIAERLGIPLRECSGVRYYPRFYGQWAGESHPEQVSVSSLIRVLGTEIDEGITELACHPGLPDGALVSSYARERVLELRTLCDARVRRFLEQHGIGLVGFAEVPRVRASTPETVR